MLIPDGNHVTHRRSMVTADTVVKCLMFLLGSGTIAGTAAVYFYSPLILRCKGIEQGDTVVLCWMRPENGANGCVDVKAMPLKKCAGENPFETITAQRKSTANSTSGPMDAPAMEAWKYKHCPNGTENPDGPPAASEPDKTVHVGTQCCGYEKRGDTDREMVLWGPHRADAQTHCDYKEGVSEKVQQYTTMSFFAMLAVDFFAFICILRCLHNTNKISLLERTTPDESAAPASFTPPPRESIINHGDGTEFWESLISSFKDGLFSLWAPSEAASPAIVDAPDYADYSWPVMPGVSTA